MGSDGSRTATGGRLLAVTTDEQRLDDAMRTADPRLLASLREEELRRRRRRWRLIGVLLMSATLIGMVWTALVLFAQIPPNTEQALSAAQEGWSLWRSGKLAQAEEQFLAATKLDPKLANAWNGLGWSRMNQGKRDEARDAFLECVKLEDGHPAAHNGLGWYYFGQRAYDEAEKHWLKVAENADAAWSGLAKSYLLRGKYDDAAKWARRASNANASDDEMKRVLAAAQAKKLDDDLRREIEPQAPASGDAEAQRGWQFFNRGMSAQAQQEFEAALKKNPDHAAALNGLGFVLLNGGKAGEARPHFEKCLKFDPKAAGAMNGLARCLKAEGKTAEAIATWEKMVKEFPGVHAGHAGLASTYLEMGEFEKAIPYFEKLVAQQPSDESFKSGLESAREGLRQNQKK